MPRPGKPAGGNLLIACHDDKEMRCALLGHQVSFCYCRNVEGHPCRRMLQCWSMHFDVLGYLQEWYTAEDIEALFAPPRSKIAQLLDLVEKARGKG